MYSMSLQNILMKITLKTLRTFAEVSRILCIYWLLSICIIFSFCHIFRIVPKFMKRLRSPDYKDKNVFGVPLLVVLQRTGQPLPQCMLYAMRCLRRNAKESIGIFRKPGVRSRIQKLRNQIEANPGALVMLL